MVNSKQKGASWEREVCRSLSLWISGGEQEDVFWRSAMSGGRSTVAAKRGKRLAAQAGDISCIHHIGSKFADLFLLECKHYESLDFHGLITGGGHLLDFWKTVCKEADRCGKMPFLIAKQNRIPPIACLTYQGTYTLGITGSVLVLAPHYDLSILNWHNFLSTATPI